MNTAPNNPSNSSTATTLSSSTTANTSASPATSVDHAHRLPATSTTPTAIAQQLQQQQAHSSSSKLQRQRSPTRSDNAETEVGSVLDYATAGREGEYDDYDLEEEEEEEEEEEGEEDFRPFDGFSPDHSQRHSQLTASTTSKASPVTTAAAVTAGASTSHTSAPTTAAVAAGSGGGGQQKPFSRSITIVPIASTAAAVTSLPSGITVRAVGTTPHQDAAAPSDDEDFDDDEEEEDYYEDDEEEQRRPSGQQLLAGGVSVTAAKAAAAAAASGRGYSSSISINGISAGSLSTADWKTQVNPEKQQQEKQLKQQERNDYDEDEFSSGVLDEDEEVARDQRVSRASRGDSSSPSLSTSSSQSEESRPPLGLPANLPPHLLRAISVRGASVASAQPAQAERTKNWLRQHQQPQANDDRERLSQQQKQEQLIRSIKQQQQSQKEKEDSQQLATNQLLLKYSSITLSNAASSSDAAKSRSSSVSGTSAGSFTRSLGSSVTFSKAGGSPSDDRSRSPTGSSDSYLSEGSSAGGLPNTGSVTVSNADWDTRTGSSVSLSKVTSHTHEIPKSLGSSITLSNFGQSSVSLSAALSGSSISISNANSFADPVKSVNSSVIFPNQASTESVSKSLSRVPKAADSASVDAADSRSSSPSVSESSSRGSTPVSGASAPSLNLPKGLSKSSLSGENSHNLGDSLKPTTTSSATSSDVSGARNALQSYSVRPTDSVSSSLLLEGVSTTIVTAQQAPSSISGPDTDLQTPVSSGSSQGGSASSHHHRCSECSAVFENGTKYRQHIINSHSARGSRPITPPTSAKPPHCVRCSICLSTFSSTILLQKHKIEVHSQVKNTNEKKDNSVVKRKPFKLVQRCRKCNIKRFPNFKEFERHHLVHISEVKATLKLVPLTPEQLQRCTAAVESNKKAAAGKKRGRKPGAKKGSNYDDDKDFTVGKLKLTLKVSEPRGGSGRVKRRVSIVNSGMSALLEDSDGEGFEEFEDLPDIPQQPPDTAQREESSTEGNKESSSPRGGAGEEGASPGDGQPPQADEGDQEYLEQDQYHDDGTVDHQDQQFDEEDQQSQHQDHESGQLEHTGNPDEAYDEDDDPDAVNNLQLEHSEEQGDEDNLEGEQEQQHMAVDTIESEETANGTRRDSDADQESSYSESDAADGEKRRDKQSALQEGHDEFDSAFNNPANLSFDSESANERPPSTYQPQFESYTGDWFQEYESGPRIAAAMAGSSSTEEGGQSEGGEHGEQQQWPQTSGTGSNGEPGTDEGEQDTVEARDREGSEASNREDQSGLFSQEVLGNENTTTESSATADNSSNTSSNNGRSQAQGGGSFEQLCLNDSFNQDQSDSRGEAHDGDGREGQGENGPRDLLSELEYLNRGGQSSNDMGQSGENSRDSHTSQQNLSRPGSNSSGQSGGHPTPPPDTSFRALATSPQASPSSPSMAGGRPSTTTSPMQGVSPAQSTSPHLAGASHMVGSPHMAGSPHMVGSPHMSGSPHLSGSPHHMMGSPHLTGSPHLAGSPHSQSQQQNVQQPNEARLTIANNLMASSSSANGSSLPSGNNILSTSYQQWPSVATTSSYASSYLGSNGLGSSGGGGMRPPMPPGVSVPYRPSPPPRVRGRPPLMGGSRPPVMRGPGRPAGSSILPPPLMPAPGGRGMMPPLQRLPGYNSQQQRQMQQMAGQKRPLSGQQTGLSPNKSQRREDINVPSRQKDNECQIIAVANRSDGLPVISNVQGGREERRSSSANSAGGAPASGESTIHLSDSITLSVRSSAANKEPVRSERTGDAGTVANLLASRGITVTPAAGEKGGDGGGGGGREERRIPTASDLNLSSAISVHPPTSRDRDGFAVPQAPSSRSSSSSREVERPPRPPTVDLTHDVSPIGSQATRLKCSQCEKTFPNQSLLADHAKVHQQAQSSRMPYKCHLCTAGFSSQKGQQHHYQQFHQLHLSTNDVAIPVVDLRNPVNVQRMAALGVRSFLPLTNLQNRGGGGIVGIPLLTLENLRNGQMTLQQWGVSDVLTLGPAKTLNMPR